MGAWLATGTGLYSVIVLHGLARSIRLRPVLVGPDYLDIRFGLLFRLRLQPQMIRQVRRADTADLESAFVMPKGSQPNICIELATEQTAHGLFGISRQVNGIALAADDPQAFERALAQLTEK